MKPNPAITILPFQPENQEQVKRLILTGLAEHWGVLDPSRNPDLNDIASTYSSAVFLVAWLQDKVVGTGAVVPQSDGSAEIVRMSVAADMRRAGIGSLLLRRLCQDAHSAGCHTLVLETTATWQDAIDFYLHFGFQITHHQDGDVYFSLDFGQAPALTE